MLGEWEILTIYNTYIKTYQKLLVTYQKMSLSFAYTTKQAQVKKKKNTNFSLESSENYISSDSFSETEINNLI